MMKLTEYAQYDGLGLADLVASKQMSLEVLIPTLPPPYPDEDRVEPSGPRAGLQELSGPRPPPRGRGWGERALNLTRLSGGRTLPP